MTDENDLDALRETLMGSLFEEMEDGGKPKKEGPDAALGDPQKGPKTKKRKGTKNDGV